MYDLIVIGGGPAGTAAAITAARANPDVTVLLLERGSFPRQKVCGEFVSSEALALLQGLSSAAGDLLVRAPRITQARLFGPGGAKITLPVAPAAASITRWELDELLWRAAMAAGVDCHDRVEVERVSRRNGQFVVHTARGEFRSRAVIDASGRWSKLNADTPARAKTVPERGTLREPFRIGVKAHFAGESGESAAASTDLYFFRGGYCGVQPVGANRLNVCAMVDSRRAARLAEVLALHPRLCERSRHWTQISEQVTTSPLRFRAPRPERDGVLCAGDAAGFIDPFAGDGISLALRSGALAATALLPFFAGQGGLDEARLRYSSAYTESFSRAFRTAAAMRTLLRTTDVLGAALWQILRLPAVARFVVRNTR